MTAQNHIVTRLLLDWRQGDDAALEKLIPIVYADLRRLAQHYMEDERQGHVLQATDLVHEAYFRLVGLELEWEGRGHFFAVAARLMRRILIDEGRKRVAEKRGGGELTVALEDVEVAFEVSTDLLALDQALDHLTTFDERRGQILELRYFGGLTLRETASVLKISSATVERELKLAKAWLNRRLRG